MIEASFYLIISDHDHRRFTVEGPMYDDRPWNIRVVAAQRRGRDVTCSPWQTIDHYSVADETFSSCGYQYSEKSLL